LLADPRATDHRPRPTARLRRRGVGVGVAVRHRVRFAAPISTTQTITASILGVGPTRRLSAVRWTVAGDIAVAWVLTIPAGAVVAAGAYFLI
jgi:PiT family inorganic phosphate transporter